MFSGPIYRFIALIWLTLPASTLLCPTADAARPRDNTGFHTGQEGIRWARPRLECRSLAPRVRRNCRRTWPMQPPGPCRTLGRSPSCLRWLCRPCSWLQAAFRSLKYAVQFCFFSLSVLRGSGGTAFHGGTSRPLTSGGATRDQGHVSGHVGMLLSFDVLAYTPLSRTLGLQGLARLLRGGNRVKFSRDC